MSQSNIWRMTNRIPQLKSSFYVTTQPVVVHDSKTWRKCISNMIKNENFLYVKYKLVQKTPNFLRVNFMLNGYAQCFLLQHLLMKILLFYTAGGVWWTTSVHLLSSKKKRKWLAYEHEVQNFYCLNEEWSQENISLFWKERGYQVIFLLKGFWDTAAYVMIILQSSFAETKLSGYAYILK